MAAVSDPANGVEFFDLSHPWGHGTPVWPGFPGVTIERGSFHALHGTLTQRFSTTMHASTHVNAPLHLVAGGDPIGAVPLDRFFGRGVVVQLEMPKWGVIEPEHLIDADPGIEPGDIVLINTGWHRRFADNQAYYAHAPGLGEAAARWLIERGVKLVGMDTPAIDHPLATSLGPQRGGPLLPRLAGTMPRRPALTRPRFFRTGSRRTGCFCRRAFRPSKTSAARSTRWRASA
jgi:kynurenine formamidase